MGITPMWNTVFIFLCQDRIKGQIYYWRDWEPMSTGH